MCNNTTESNKCVLYFKFVLVNRTSDITYSLSFQKYRKGIAGTFYVNGFYVYMYLKVSSVILEGF
jgi:hypothetical protein